MNYVLQLELGDGFSKADKAIDGLLDKIGKLSSAVIDLKIDLSGILKPGKGMGEEWADGFGKGMKGKMKNILWESKSMLQAQFPKQPEWLKNISMDESPKRKSFGGGIAQIKNLPNPTKELMTQLDDLFKVSPDAALDRMRQKSDEKFARQKQKDEERELKLRAIHAPKEMDENGGSNLNKVQSLPDLGKILEDEAKAKKLDWKKIFTGLFLGVSNPYIGSRVLSDELGKKLNAQSGGFAGGLFGKGGIAGFSEIFLAFKAFKLSTDIFKSAIEKFFNAADKADRFYSAALQNGMGLGFSIKRSTLAGIMGVSEQDIFRFGAQMAYLNPKIEWATKILAETDRPLTEASWQLKILKLDISAMSAKIATDAKPAFMDFMEVIDKLVKSLSNHSKDISNLLFGTQTDFEKFYRANGKYFAKSGGIEDQLKQSGAIKKFSFLGNSPEAIAAALGKMSEKDVNRMGVLAGMDRKHIMELRKSIFGEHSPQGIPSPQSWMKQLPASSWEKMGLGIMNSGQNYQKDIAKNTRDMAKDLKTLATAFRGVGAGGSWGMSPVGNNP